MAPGFRSRSDDQTLGSFLAHRARGEGANGASSAGTRASRGSESGEVSGPLIRGVIIGPIATHLTVGVPFAGNAHGFLDGRAAQRRSRTKGDFNVHGELGITAVAPIVIGATLQRGIASVLRILGNPVLAGNYSGGIGYHLVPLPCRRYRGRPC